MTAWKRWQDWATIVLGLIVLATPFYFNVALGSAVAWTAYAAGVLLVLGGLWSESTDQPNQVIEAIPLVVGALLFIAPWVVGFTATPTMAWMAWIVGGLSVLNSGAELVIPAQRTTTA